MKFDIVGIVLIIGALQGFALSFLIIQKGRSLFANNFLWALMLFFSVMLVSLWLSDEGLYLTYTKIMFTLEGIPLLIFPLYFLYAKYLTEKRSKLEKKDLIHFLPFLFYKTLLIPFYFMSTEDIFAFQNSSMIANYPIQYTIFNWILITQGYIYCVQTIKKIRRRDEFLNEHFSSKYGLKLNWLQNATYLALAMNVLFMVENILLFSSSSLSESFGFSSVASGIYIYAIGYLGLSRSGVFTEFAPIEKKEEIAESKYKKSGLTEAKAEEYYQKLISKMGNEKLFKQNKLTLSELAKAISVSSHNLSEVINSKTGMNFFDFINQYRIEEVKREIVRKENDNFTILGIALEAGFSSKTSFNTLFKKYEQMTPTQFRSEYIIKKDR